MKLYGFDVYGSHWPSGDDEPSAPLEPLAPYMRTQPRINAFSIEVGGTVTGSEGFWGGRPRPTLSLMWQTAATPDGPWTDTVMTSLNATLNEDHVDLYLALNVNATNDEGSASGRSNIVGPIIAEEVEPEEPVDPPVDPEEPVEPGEPDPVRFRAPSVGTDWHIHSGHSLVDVYANSGVLDAYTVELFGEPPYQYQRTHTQNTIPGSPLFVRWNNPNVNGQDAKTTIDEYQHMTITEGGPPGFISSGLENTLRHLMYFTENAYLNGNNGNGARPILWSIWPNTEGWAGPEFQYRPEWGEFGGFRGVCVEYGRIFQYMAEYTTWKMRQLYPDLPSDWRMFMIPGHAWMIRVYDDIQAGLVPGITDHTQLFSDDIHTTLVGDHGLSIFMFTALYQHNLTGNTTIPNWIPCPPDLDQYFKAMAWDLVNTYESVGMGGTVNATPVFNILEHGDVLADYVAGDGDVYEDAEEPVDPDPEDPEEPTDPVDPPANGLLHRLAAPVVMDGNNIQTIQMDNAGVAGAPIYVAMSVTPDAVQVRQSAVIMQVLDTANNNALGIVNRPDMGRLLVETGFSGNHIAYPYDVSEGKVKIEFFIDPTLTPSGRAIGPNSHENNSQSDLQLTTESVNRLRFGIPDWGGEVAVAVVHDAVVYSGIPTEAEREAILAALL